MQYRTEIVVAADRYVCLQLPDFIPPGRAIVTVIVTSADDLGDGEGLDHANADDRGHDVEWWDEFEGDDPRRD